MKQNGSLVSPEILVVDDEIDIRELMAGILADEGYETRVASDSDATLSAIAQRRPHLVVLDVWLQGSRLDGIQVFDVIKKGAYDFIEKPFKADRLCHVVKRAIEAARLKREIEELKLKAGDDTDLAGNSTALSQLRQQVEKVAPTGSRILITGPAGSGKEVTARLIHS